MTPILGIVGTARQYSFEQGQIDINEGRYQDAIREFTCLIEWQPIEVEGYRERFEAKLLLGRYSGTFRPRAAAPSSARPRLQLHLMIIPALAGASFARWCFSINPAAIHLLDDPPAVSLITGMGICSVERVICSRLSLSMASELDRAIAFAPESSGIRFIVAKTYTYGNVPDPQRAFAEACSEWPVV